MSVATTNQLALEKIKQAIKDRGQSHADYARQKGLDYNTLAMVLGGRMKGTRGEAHRCMVALGLKKEVKNG